MQSLGASRSLPCATPHHHLPVLSSIRCSHSSDHCACHSHGAVMEAGRNAVYGQFFRLRDRRAKWATLLQQLVKAFRFQQTHTQLFDLRHRAVCEALLRPLRQGPESRFELTAQ
jgi:hypothetical protein